MDKEQQLSCHLGSLILAGL